MKSKSTDDLLRKAPTLELRFDPASSGKFWGYASAFGGPPDSYGDIVQKGAFTRTLEEHKANGTLPLMLWSHDMSVPIGRWLEAREDDFGLFMTGEFNMQTTRGRDAFAHMKAGDISGLSIGWMSVPNGSKKGAGGTNLITDLELIEVSVVAYPANSRARIRDVKTVKTKAELVDLLRASGLPKAAAERVAAGGFQALTGADYQKANDLADAIERATANLRITK